MNTHHAAQAFRYFGSVSLLAALLLPRTSHASATFPEAIKEQLAMSCAPPCTTCHRTLEGGLGTVDKAFGGEMLKGGLVPLEPSSVATALASVEWSMIDSDGDGAQDVQELRDGSDPNVSGDGASDALICGPAYGCGARVAKAPPLDASALTAALALAAFLFVRRRR